MWRCDINIKSLAERISDKTKTDIDTVKYHLTHILSELKMEVGELESAFNNYELALETSVHGDVDSELLAIRLALWPFVIKAQYAENKEYSELLDFIYFVSNLNEQELAEAYEVTGISLRHTEMVGRVAKKIMHADEKMTYAEAVIKANRQVDELCHKFALTNEELVLSYLASSRIEKSLETAAVIGSLAKAKVGMNTSIEKYHECVLYIYSTISNKIDPNALEAVKKARQESLNNALNTNDENLDEAYQNEIESRVKDIDETKVAIVDCEQIFKYLKGKFGELRQDHYPEAMTFTRLVVLNTDNMSNTAEVIKKIDGLCEKYGLSFDELDYAIMCLKDNSLSEGAAIAGREAKKMMSSGISYEQALTAYLRIPSAARQMVIEHAIREKNRDEGPEKPTDVDVRTPKRWNHI